MKMTEEQPGRRIAVIGVTGSGKTTLAQQLAAALQLAHVELDALHWGPGWTPTPADLFREKVGQALTAVAWVTDGNYSKVRDIVWQRADTVVWLDYPLPLILWRLLRRGVRRAGSQEPLWNGNRETWRGLFLSRDSLFLWALQSYGRRKREYPALLAQPAYAHLCLYHFHHPRQTARWLENVTRIALLEQASGRDAHNTDTADSP
jgi:adenylate kinase family enzyme